MLPQHLLTIRPTNLWPARDDDVDDGNYNEAHSLVPKRSIMAILVKAASERAGQGRLWARLPGPISRLHFPLALGNWRSLDFFVRLLPCRNTGLRVAH